MQLLVHSKPDKLVGTPGEAPGNDPNCQAPLPMPPQSSQGSSVCSGGGWDSQNLHSPKPCATLGSCIAGEHGCLIGGARAVVGLGREGRGKKNKKKRGEKGKEREKLHRLCAGGDWLTVLFLRISPCVISTLGSAGK